MGLSQQPARQRTGGRVGYIHLPDFASNGLNSFVTQYYGQIEKEALIIDFRWSVGGSIPDILIKLMDRASSTISAVATARVGLSKRASIAVRNVYS